VFQLSPKSCTNSWSDSGDRELDSGDRVLFIPELPSLTGLTGAAHRYDRCISSVGFASSECLGEFIFVPCCCCFEFGLVWSSVGLFCGFGVFLA
jgi:hypothetical protein